MGTFYDSLGTWFKGKISVSVLVLRLHTTEWIFRLHYIWTTWLLLVFVSMLCWKEWLGGHIKCLPIEEDTANVAVIPLKVINSFCYVSSTFSVPFDRKKDAFAAQGPMPVHRSQLGGGQYIAGKSETLQHSYYQWVAYFLFLQALVFQLTMFIWTHYENKKIAHIVQELNVKDLEAKNEGHHMAQLAKYLIDSKGSHFWYSFIYICCEFGNLAVVLLNMYITDVFLGGEFSQYGIKVFEFLEKDPEERTDPMAMVFPRVTKCLFHKYGPSGSIQRFDTLCILTSNIVNEKIFAFLWLWFIFVAVLTGAQVLYRIATLLSSRVRLMGLNIETFPVNSQVSVVLDRFYISDWILLRLLRLNLPEHKFQNLIRKLYDHILEG